MAFSKRIINLRFELGQGDFGTSGQDTVDIEGLRCSVNYTRAGQLTLGQLELRCWGMPMSLMNKLTVQSVTAFPEQRNNILTVSAGDEIGGVAVLFRGLITEAWAEGSTPPDISFHVTAQGTNVPMIKPIPPTSYRGTIDVVTALNGIAAQMGLTLENAGVSGTIENPYWPGSLDGQLRAICEHANCQADPDTAKGVLSVVPRGGKRNLPPVQISAETGMVSYPNFTQSGLQVRTLFNPELQYNREVKVESIFKPASGSWVIAAINHQLDSLVPDGSWFTEIECGLLGHPLPVIQ